MIDFKSREDFSTIYTAIAEHKHLSADTRLISTTVANVLEEMHNDGTFRYDFHFRFNKHTSTEYEFHIGWGDNEQEEKITVLVKLPDAYLSHHFIIKTRGMVFKFACHLSTEPAWIKKMINRALDAIILVLDKS